MAGNVSVIAVGESFEEVKAKLREVVGFGEGGEAEALTPTSAIEYILSQMPNPVDFQVHVATRELTFETNQGGIPQTIRVPY